MGYILHLAKYINLAQAISSQMLAFQIPVFSADVDQLPKDALHISQSFVFAL